jgi:hypothetical protein
LLDDKADLAVVNDPDIMPPSAGSPEKALRGIKARASGK